MMWPGKVLANKVLSEFDYSYFILCLFLLSAPIPFYNARKSECQTTYTEVCHSSLVDIFPYVDVLGATIWHHCQGTLGLLPFLWVISVIEIHKGPSLAWLLTTFFDDKKERSRIKVDTVISNIRTVMKTRFVSNFSGVLPRIMFGKCSGGIPKTRATKFSKIFSS